MAAIIVRGVPRFSLLFATVRAVSTVGSQAGSVYEQRTSSLLRPIKYIHQCPRQAFPYISSYNCRFSSTSEEERKWDDVRLNEFQSLLQEEDTYVIDVREPQELKEFGRFQVAINIPLGDVVEALKLDESAFEQKYGKRKPSSTSDKIIFHCMGGIRSRTAVDAAHELGYDSARHYIGGWEEWSDKVLGKPIVL